MKEIITEIMVTLLLMLVRTIFGVFIGGFLGSMVGGVVSVLLFLDKAGNQINVGATTGIFVFTGAIFGALVGASNLLAAKDTDKSRLEDYRRNDKSGDFDDGEE